MPPILAFLALGSQPHDGVHLPRDWLSLQADGCDDLQPLQRRERAVSLIILISELFGIHGESFMAFDILDTPFECGHASLG